MPKREEAAEALLRLIEAHREELTEYLVTVIAEGPQEPGAPEPCPDELAVTDVRYAPNEATGTDVLVTFANDYAITFCAR